MSSHTIRTLDMSAVTITTSLPKILVFRLKLAFYIMKFASIVGGFHFVVEEDEITHTSMEEG
jgi:hypothetical protein